MAWTPPTTWATNQVVSADDFNAQIQGNMTYLFDAITPLGVAATGAAGIVAPSTEYTFTYNNARYDLGGFTGTTTTDLTIPFAGFYVLTVAGTLSGTTTWTTLFYVNSTLLDLVDWPCPGSLNYRHPSISQFNAGDVIQCRFKHTSTTSQTIYAPELTIQSLVRG